MTTEPTVASKTAWKAARKHPVTLPSGVNVEVQIPDLPNLIKAGAFPNELIDIAIGVAGGKKVTRDDVAQQADFYNKLCAITVTNPKVSEEEFASNEFPFEDKEMLVEIATRQRDLDAVGHHLGGLEKSKDFRAFRGIIGGDENVEGI